MSVVVDVVSVFVDERGEYGNKLGIVRSSDATRGREQAIAATLGFSETVFLDRDGDGAVQIFTPAAELPFAGHPCVGTAWWLRTTGAPVTALRVKAGEVGVRYEDELTWISADPSWTSTFSWSEVDSPGVLAAVDPDSFTEGHNYVYAWLDREAGDVVSRMFAPVLGIREDQATGAAAIRFTAHVDRDLTIRQGLGSVLRTHRLPGGRVEVGGRTRFVEQLTI
jgi:predicted PhzF superfamily epimerase YddE/YHI9